jgi:hypothetical protein
LNQREGVGAMEGAATAENRVEKSFWASTAFAASEGWNASQKTYSLRLLHNLELGKHSPPMDESTLQHDVLEILKPAEEKEYLDLRQRLYLCIKFMASFVAKLKETFGFNYHKQ